MAAHAGMTLHDLQQEEKAILDSSVASIYEDDNRIRASWPIIIGGKSI